MSIDDEVRKKHAQELVDAKTAFGNSDAKFNNCMDKSFLNPASARQKIDAYQAKNPGNAIYDKLAENPRGISAFGRRPGSLASKDFFTPGASQRRQESIIERQNLAPLMKQRSADKQRLDGAQRAYDTTMASGPPSAAGQAPTDKPKSIAADHSRAPRVSGYMPERSPQVAQPALAKVNDNRNAAEADRIREGMADRRAQEKKREQGQGR